MLCPAIVLNLEKLKPHLCTGLREDSNIPIHQFNLNSIIFYLACNRCYACVTSGLCNITQSTYTRQFRKPWQYLKNMM